MNDKIFIVLICVFYIYIVKYWIGTYKDYSTIIKIFIFIEIACTGIVILRRIIIHSI